MAPAKERKCYNAYSEKQIYTEFDYYALPQNVRAELIEGQIYYQAAPSRAHQKVLNAVNNAIYNYLKSKNGSCEVYPAPFAVKLKKDKNTIIEIVSPGNSSHDYIRKLNLYADAGVREYWIVNPMKQTIFAYFLAETMFEVNTYTFQDKIRANIYDDLWIDFRELNL